MCAPNRIGENSVNLQRWDHAVV